MPKIALTPRMVDTLQVEPGRTRTVYLDTHPSAPKGFALRVTAAGARSFYLIRTVKAKGRRPWVYIAPGQGSGLEAARRAAELRGAEISMGRDPNEEARLARAAELQRTADDQAWSVADMLAAYIQAKRNGLAPNTVYRYERHLKRDVLDAMPELALKAARHVTRADVRRMVATISERSPTQGRLALQFLAAGFRWAMDEEVLVPGPDGRAVLMPRVDRDPCRGIEVERGKPRERVLTDHEIQQFWRGLDKLPLPKATLARIVLLNGTRREETFMVKREDLSLDVQGAEAWYIPKQNRKGRRRGGQGEQRALTIPLAPLSVRLFRALVAHQPKSHLFDRLPIGDLPATIQEATGISDITVHDLRRSCASGLQRLGCPPHVISIVLGHAREEGATQVDGVYMHDRRVSEHRAWLEKWAAYIEALLAAM